MKLSNNMHGEALVKTMGQEATGTAVGRRTGRGACLRQSQGVDISTLRISDGSGCPASTC